MFPRSEFRSIWEVAHNWSGLDPLQSPEPLPEDVQENILKITWAYIRKKVALRTLRLGRSWRIPEEDINLLVFFLNLNRARVKLLGAAQTKQFDKSFLDGIYVMRADILNWCKDEYLDPPPMWKQEAAATDGVSKKPNGRHYDEEIDKNRCQAIAMALPPEAWDYSSALEWVLDQYKETNPRDSTIREKFNTYRFADYKEQVIDLLSRVCRVSVETQTIISR